MSAIVSLLVHRPEFYRAHNVIICYPSWLVALAARSWIKLWLNDTWLSHKLNIYVSMKISGLWNVNVNTVRGSFKWYLLYTYWGRKTLEGLFAAVKYINFNLKLFLIIYFLKIVFGPNVNLNVMIDVALFTTAISLLALWIGSNPQGHDDLYALKDMCCH